MPVWDDGIGQDRAMPGAVLFDLDNTLVDRDGAMRAYLADVIADPEVLARAIAADRSGYGGREDLLAVLAAADVHTDADGLAAAVRARITPDAAAVEAARFVRARAAVAIVTNGRATSQRGKLAAGGLDALTPLVFISEEVGAAKPDPAIFRRALDALGCPAADAVFVGDDPARDIAGAAAVDMATCWVAGGRDRTGSRATWIVDHVGELPALWSRPGRQPR